MAGRFVVAAGFVLGCFAAGTTGILVAGAGVLRRDMDAIAAGRSPLER